MLKQIQALESAFAPALSPGLSELKTVPAAIILLDGALRPTQLRSAIGRSILELPVDHKRSVLDCWQEQGAELAECLGARVPIRVVLDARASRPKAVVRTGITVERDPIEYRGTGGVLKDLAASYQPDDYLLVANGAQILRSSLTETLSALSAVGGDVAVVGHQDGTPSGFMLVRCGCLEELPEVGFVDMKEQGLATIAKRHNVRVVDLEVPSGLPTRTLGDYIQALRAHHTFDTSPIAEWKTLFSIIESGSDVHLHARVHDSVVLCGAKLEAGAVVVGSVVCPGAVVRRGEVCIDQVVVPAQGR